MMNTSKARGDRWETAALRIFSETLSVEEIATAIKYKATQSYEKGKPVSMRSPHVLRTKSAWILDSEVGQDHGLSTQLDWLVTFIESRLDAFTLLLSTCKLDLFCGFSSGTGQGGTVLDKALLARLGRLGLDLKIDLYPPGPRSKATTIINEGDA
jgi:hypothetical protein